VVPAATRASTPWPASPAPCNVYLRAADLLPAIDSWLLLIFAPHRLDQNLSGDERA
jgi:hypothetical protein